MMLEGYFVHVAVELLWRRVDKEMKNVCDTYEKGAFCDILKMV